MTSLLCLLVANVAAESLLLTGSSTGVFDTATMAKYVFFFFFVTLRKPAQLRLRDNECDAS